MPQDGAHDVHLRVAGGAVAALGVDRLKDCCCGRQRQARAAIFLGHQDREVTGLGQGLDELGGIAAHLVELAPVFAGEMGAEFCDLLADFGMRVGGHWMVHARRSRG